MRSRQNARNNVLHYKHILANFQISERGTNERKKIKKRNIPKFPIHYYTKIAAKTGTHDKIILFFASKRGTVPPKEEQLASMQTATFDPHKMTFPCKLGQFID